MLGWIGFAMVVCFLIVREWYRALPEPSLIEKVEQAIDWTTVTLASAKHRVGVLEDISVTLMDLRQAIEDEKEAAWWNK